MPFLIENVFIYCKYECLQVDGAKLVSVNSPEEHMFIVRWLMENAQQGYISLLCLFVLFPVW